MTHPRDTFLTTYSGQIGLWPEHLKGSPEALTDVATDLLALVVLDCKTDQFRAHLNPILPADDESTWRRVVEACAEFLGTSEVDSDLIWQYSQATDEAMCVIPRGGPRAIAFEVPSGPGED